MFQLISVTRLELDITESYHKTKQEAIDAMIKDMIISTPYESLDEIIEAADAGECGFSDDEAWAETNQHETGQWKIVELPNTLSVDTPDGTIIAEAHNDEDYPAIWLFKNETNSDCMMASVEYNSDEKRMQTEVYQRGADDMIAMFDFETGEDIL